MSSETNKLTSDLEIDGTLKIKSTDTGFGLQFFGSEYSLGVKGQNSVILQKGSDESGNRDRIFEVWLEYSEDRSQVISKSFLFDNVDVFPDNDDQKLGKPENRWKELNAVNGSFSGHLNVGSLNMNNLRTAPDNAQTVELVMDKATGEIYRKA
jgi:hypothetical protein